MRFLLTPRWIAAHIFVVVLGLTCVYLGAWQLDRHREQQLTNAVHAARMEAPAIEISAMVASAAGDHASLQYRRATVTGSFVTEEEVLVRSQVHEGRAGYHVVTPLLLDAGIHLDAGGVVLVNRGWVPLEFDTVPVAAAPVPQGPTTVEGIVRSSAPRGIFGRDDAADDHLVILSRIDIPLIDRQVTGDLLPVYIEVVGSPRPTVLPVPLPEPDLTDEGPHLSYAVQWFSFALVGAFGYGFLIRRARRRQSTG